MGYATLKCYVATATLFCKVCTWPMNPSTNSKPASNDSKKKTANGCALAGISRLTKLPNSLMFFQVVLPQELDKGKAETFALSCILISPDKLGDVNQKTAESAATNSSSSYSNS